MPPKPPASTFAPTALGAALLGLSAALLAVDVGGTVVLDAPSGTPERTSANPPTGPAQAPQSAAQAPQLAAQPATLPVSLARHVYEPPAASRSNPAAPAHRPTVLAPERRPTLLTAERHAPAERQRITNTASATAAASAHLVRPAVVSLSHAPQAPRSVAPPAPRGVAAPAQPKPAGIASLSDVRHFAMRRLSSNYPNISVISADTYSIGGNNVRVSMVVQDGSQRWVEKDVVKRSGTSLALEASARHGMPFTSAMPQASTLAEPDAGP